MSEVPLDIRMDGADALLAVRVTPKASRNEIAGAHAGALRVAVTAPPEKGKANAAVVALLAKRLGVAKSSISIEGARFARTKRVRIAGVSASELSRRLAAFL